MLDSERGKLRSRLYATQPRDFSGLRFGKITPTDIDAFIDFKDDIFVFIEAKFRDGELPYGQRLALERLTDACARAGKTSVLIIASHHNQIGDVDYAEMQVNEIRFNGKYRTVKVTNNVRQAIDTLLQWLDAQRSRSTA